MDRISLALFFFLGWLLCLPFLHGENIDFPDEEFTGTDRSAHEQITADLVTKYITTIQNGQKRC